MTIDGKKSVFPQGLTIMPSRTNATVSILISSTRSTEKQKIRVRLLPLAGSSTIAVAGLEGRFRELTLSDLRTNPKRAWNEMGRPLKSLNKTQIFAIRNASKIEMGDISTIPQGLKITSKCAFFCHQVTQVAVCASYRLYELLYHTSTVYTYYIKPIFI